ncbi:OB-fold domain-containing protein, partial [uncultured Duncaniella sp.]|uniref:OB-fold domain-containing protein n=1 Tax=uncultured Duncaniella sp. TaxID=2768039 RepID=UPI00349F8834
MPGRQPLNQNFIRTRSFFLHATISHSLLHLSNKTIMYEYIKGIITENTPTYVSIETGGMGYMINISLNTFEALQNCKGEVKLLLHEV